LIDLLCVDPKEVHQIWPQAKELIRTAIERTDLSDFRDIEYDVLAGDQLLWLAISNHVEAAATTHLTRIRGKTVLVVTACAGHGKDRWLPLKARIEQYAKAEGAKCVRLYGRKGWARELKDYHVQYVIMEKDLA
jgi:hypothetical protein